MASIARRVCTPAWARPLSARRQAPPLLEWQRAREGQFRLVAEPGRNGRMDKQARSLEADNIAPGTRRRVAEHNSGLRDAKPERAILVGVDVEVRFRPHRAGVEGARGAARSKHDLDHTEEPLRTSPPSPAGRSTALDAEESLAEFRELVLSAGGEIAAELLQRRPRPDPATL